MSLSLSLSLVSFFFLLHFVRLQDEEETFVSYLLLYEVIPYEKKRIILNYIIITKVVIEVIL